MLTPQLRRLDVNDQTKGSLQMSLVIRTNSCCDSEGSTTRQVEPTVIIIESDAFILSIGVPGKTKVKTYGSSHESRAYETGKDASAPRSK